MLRFHRTGSWTREQVSWEFSDDTRPRIEAVEQLIERTWADAIREPGMHLFDGPMCRLEQWSASAHRLHLKLSRTSYKPFFGTNLRNPHLADRYGPAVLANPVGVSPALHSSDNYLLLGRRNGSVAYYPDRLHPFAGALEPREDLDVFDEVMRELREELSFADDDVAGIHCTGIVEDVRLRQPELIFAVRSTRTREQIEAQVDRTEHGGSIAIPATAPDLERALGDSADFTPIAVASLLLWGRLAFGQDWFERVAAEIGSP